MIQITKDIALDEDELQFDFVRAAGPGGQNVNRVATAVQLRFDVRRSPSLTESVRARLMRLAGNRINKDGVLIINARRFRTQTRNRKDAIDRLSDLVRRAAQREKPRKKTRPSNAARERRLQEKRRRSRIKNLRRIRPTDME
ncbi:MAG: alternative ribosome rescue aminoacyl-tRNA hydrolase ArfB [Anaerolineales bacterium]|jgi:ribosome-associated protein